MTGADKIELAGRAEDAAVAAASLAEIHASLQPHYNVIADRLFGSEALRAVAIADVRYRHAEADMDLLEGFGKLLPTEQVNGEYIEELGGYFEDRTVRILDEDPNTINMVRAHAIRIGGNETSYRNTDESRLPHHFAYVVGAQALANKQVELVLIRPERKAVYTHIMNGEEQTKEKNTNVQIVRTIIHPNGLKAIEAYTEDALNNDLNEEQLLAMRLSGAGMYSLPVPEVPSLDLWAKGQKPRSRQRLSSVHNKGVRAYYSSVPGIFGTKLYTTTQPMGTTAFTNHSLADYRAEKYLTTLASAFGMTEDLGQLLLERTAKIEKLEISGADERT